MNSKIAHTFPRIPWHIPQELSTVADWGGAGCWGRMINQNYAGILRDWNSPALKMFYLLAVQYRNNQVFTLF